MNLISFCLYPYNADSSEVLENNVFYYRVHSLNLWLLFIVIFPLFRQYTAQSALLWEWEFLISSVQVYGIYNFDMFAEPTRLSLDDRKLWLLIYWD